MEPVFMITSQSAATAAALAINDGVPVQQVVYRKLAVQLLSDRQLLQWGTAPVVPEDGIVVDCEEADGVVVTGTWSTSSSVAGFHGANYFHDDNAAKGTKSVRFAPELSGTGEYIVYLRWTAHANRASNVPVTLRHRDGAAAFRIDQRVNGSAWFPLGTFQFEAGTPSDLLLETTGTTGYVVADAALWVPPSSNSSAVEVFAADPEAGEEDSDPGTFLFFRTGGIAADVTIQYAVSGTAAPSVDFVASANSIKIPAGQTSARFEVQPLLDSEVEGDETVILTILPNPDYSIGELSTATVTFRDAPFDGWRAARFSSEELSNPSASGEAADPDEDSLPNLLEFLLGRNPTEADSAPGLRVTREDSDLFLEIPRHRDAASLHLTVETSTGLLAWETTDLAPAIFRDAPFETLRYSLGAIEPGSGGRFWRIRVRR